MQVRLFVPAMEECQLREPVQDARPVMFDESTSLATAPIIRMVTSTVKAGVVRPEPSGL